MKNVILSAIVSMLFIGCAFNPNHKEIFFEGGTPYYVPVGTSKYVVITKDQEQNFILFDEKCRAGSIAWISWEAVDNGFNEINEKSDIQGMRELFDRQLVGCTPAMNKEEFEYRMQEIKAENSGGSFTDGLNRAMKGFADGYKSSADSYSQIQQNNTLNSINRNLQELNQNLYYNNQGGGYYNPR